MKIKEDTKLSPPWYVLYDTISACFGVDSLIEVSDFIEEGRNFRVNLTTAVFKKARALDEILIHEFNFGNIKVFLDVLFEDKKLDINFYNNYLTSAQMVNECQKQVKKIIDDALRTNPYYISAILVPDMPLIPECVRGSVSLNFDNKIIQFYADDIADIFGNRNVIAADAFKELLRENYYGCTKITFATAPCNFSMA